MRLARSLAAAGLVAGLSLAGPAPAQDAPGPGVQLGPRPHYLIGRLEAGPLRRKLEGCAGGPLRRTRFSIGHRGAPLQFPEHTRESYEAAAAMGAGALECDVTFTRDRRLVCRHSQCDLHRTTNILTIPELAAKCSEPFTPADPATGKEASARCCTSDLTLDEFARLCGKMDGFEPGATTVDEYLAGTPSWRTELYASCGTLMSHRDSIHLFRELGVHAMPELKEPLVPMPFEGSFTGEQYAQQLIDEYEAAGVAPEAVWPQSFQLEDVRYWIAKAPRFGRQAVYLDGRREEDGFDPAKPYTWSPTMKELADQGVHVLGAPLWMLLTVDDQLRIVPSQYARSARRSGLDIVAWTLERSGPLATGEGVSDYRSIAPAVRNDGTVLRALHVLARDVGVRGVFSDWPATTTYYASCMGLP